MIFLQSSPATNALRDASEEIVLGRFIDDKPYKSFVISQLFQRMVRHCLEQIVGMSRRARRCPRQIALDEVKNSDQVVVHKLHWLDQSKVGHVFHSYRSKLICNRSKPRNNNDRWDHVQAVLIRDFSKAEQCHIAANLTLPSKLFRSSRSKCCEVDSSGRENCLSPRGCRRPPIKRMAKQLKWRAVDCVCHVYVNHGRSLAWAEAQA